jgi:tetratricopeptide (TPR) repeat protein
MKAPAFIVFLIGVLGFECVSAAVTADSLAARATDQYSRGDFEAAIDPWQRAAESHRRKGNTPALIDTLTQLGGAYHALGQHRLAVQALDEAVKLARESDDRVRLANALSGLGAVNMFSRDAADAEKTLREALKVARGTEDREACAAALNNLGNLLAAQEKFDDAENVYREAIAAAAPGTLDAKARANLASVAVAKGDFAEVPALNRAASEAANALPDSHEKAFVLLRAGRTWEALFEKAPAHEPAPTWRRLARL